MRDAICSYCKKAGPTKPLAAYWSWYTGPNEREAYRVRYCLNCAIDHFVPLRAASRTSDVIDRDDIDFCPIDGQSTFERLSSTFCTFYRPYAESDTMALLACDLCQERVRDEISRIGTALKDRPANRERARQRSDTDWSFIFEDSKQTA